MQSGGILTLAAALPLLALTLLLPAAAGAPTQGTLWTTWDVSVDGGVLAESSACRLWLRALDTRMQEGQAAAFELTGTRLHVVERAYESKTVTYNDQLVWERKEEPALTPHNYSAATISVTRLAPFGEMRVIMEPGSRLALASEPKDGAIPAAMVYPDAHMAQELKRYETPTYLADDEANDFMVIPEERFLFLTKDASAQLQGPFRLWIHGADLLVRHADGTDPLAGYPQQSVGTDVEGSPAKATVSEWVDFVISVPADGALRMQWRDHAELFGTNMRLATDGQVAFPRASGAVLDEPLDDDAYRLEGPLVADVDYTTVDSRDGSEWTLLDGAAPAPLERGADPMGAASWLWLAFLAMGLVAGGGSTAAALHRYRYPTLDPSRPVPPPSPTGAPRAPDGAAAKAERGVELAAQGKYGEALTHLEGHVKADPGDPHVRYLYALSLAHVGHADDAIAQLDFALRLDPALLGVFVTDPHTETFRHDAEYALFVKRQARTFRDNHNRGYV